MASDHSWLDDRPRRLGDLIDDHCPRCKRLTNHVIASFMGDKVVKVVCQACHSEHPFYEGKERKKKPKATAFDQVLAKASPSAEPKKESTAGKTKAKSGQRPLIRHKASPSGEK